MCGGGLSGTLAGNAFCALQMYHINSAGRFISVGLDLRLAHSAIICSELRGTGKGVAIAHSPLSLALGIIF